MERKSGTVAVTTEEVRAALGRTRSLTAEEEKTLRMRHGAKVEHDQPLPRAAAGNAELEDELLLIELQLARAMRARMMLQRPRPQSSAQKEKIVRALRRKK